MEWMGILWMVAALILVGPAAYRMIRGNPDAALKSVAFWLGIIVFMAWLYVHGGVGEWWEAKHGGGAPRTAPVENTGGY